MAAVGYDKGNYYARYLRHKEDAEKQRLAVFEAKRRYAAVCESDNEKVAKQEAKNIALHRGARNAHLWAAAEELANAQAAGQVPGVEKPNTGDGIIRGLSRLRDSLAPKTAEQETIERIEMLRKAAET
jgi:predicted ATP-grasp superfamily ATP-dependent carboligase